MCVSAPFSAVFKRTRLDGCNLWVCSLHLQEPRLRSISLARAQHGYLGSFHARCSLGIMDAAQLVDMYSTLEPALVLDVVRNISRCGGLDAQQQQQAVMQALDSLSTDAPGTSRRAGGTLQAASSPVTHPPSSAFITISSDSPLERTRSLDALQQHVDAPSWHDHPTSMVPGTGSPGDDQLLFLTSAFQDIDAALVKEVWLQHGRNAQQAIDSLTAMQTQDDDTHMLAAAAEVHLWRAVVCRCVLVT